MPRATHNPETLFNSLQYGFSQVAIAEGRRIVTLSGQVGWDENQQIAKDDLYAQTMKAFENIIVALQSVDATLDDILTLRIYIVASVMDDTGAISEALKRYFPIYPPTTTWIGVPRLANKDFLIEIEAMAVMP